MVKNLFRTKSKTGELNLIFLFLIFNIIPTLIAVVYYTLIASDIYVSKTQFSIYNNEEQTSPIDLGAISQLTSGNIQSESMQEILMASEYIKSYDMLKKLDSKLDLKSIYSDRSADSFSKLSDNPTNKEFLEYYNDMVSVKVNREAFIVSIEVKAFKPKDAQDIAAQINIFTEDFINKMLARVKRDALVEANLFIKTSEDKIKRAQNELNYFRIKNTILDPNAEIETKLQFIGTLEEKKAEYLIEKNEKTSLFSSKTPTLQSVKNKISNTSNLIEEAKKELLNITSEDSNLIREYSMLALDEEFAKEEYKLALVNLEETIKDQSRMNKYVVEILKPALPDVATEPKRMVEIFTVFIVSFILCGVMGLIISAVRDHIIF